MLTMDDYVRATRAAQGVMSAGVSGLIVDGKWGKYTTQVYTQLTPALRSKVDATLRVFNTDATALRTFRESLRATDGPKAAVGTLQEVERRLVARATSAGIRGASLVNLLANVKHESAFRPQREDHRYTKPGSAQRVFRALSGLSNSAVAALVAKGREAFFEATYGPQTARGKDLGNVQPGDGGKFYGRGLLQITGRSNYEAFNRAYPQYGALNNPDVLVTNLDASIDAAIHYWKTRVERLGKHLDAAASARAVAGSEQGVAAKVASAKAYSATLMA